MDKKIKAVVTSITKEYGQDKLKEVCQFILKLGLRRISILTPATTAKNDTTSILAQRLCKAAGGSILEVLAELNQPASVETAHCPFCGADVEFDKTEYDSEGGTEKWWCPECHSHGVNIMSAPQFLKYDELYDGNGNPVDPDNLPEVVLSQFNGFAFKLAKQDIIDYLSTQDEEYFSDRGRTKEAVLADTALIDELAAEHHKCVAAYGSSREWSIKDACDNDPGIYKPEE